MGAEHKEIGFKFTRPHGEFTRVVAALARDPNIVGLTIVNLVRTPASEVHVEGRTRMADVCLAEHLAKKLGNQFAETTVITFESSEPDHRKRIWGIRPAALSDLNKPFIDD